MGLFVKRAKVFWNLAMNRRRGLRRPVCVYLFLTDRCNMNCSYCFVECEKPRNELSGGEWISLIDGLARRGAKHVCLMGGEPLLHPFFGPIVDCVKSHGMFCEAVTNGLLVSKEIADLKKLDSLTISLDGGPESNDLHRRTLGGRGVYERVVVAVRCACEAGIITRINAVLTKQSIGDVDDLLALTDRFGLFVAFSPIGNYPKWKEQLIRPLLPSEEDYKRAFRKIKERKSKGACVLSSHAALDYLIEYPRPYHEIIYRGDPEAESFGDIHCPFGKSILCVGSEGEFYPCPAFFNEGSFRPKSIKDGIDTAWDHLSDLECVACSCPAVVDWNRAASLGGLADGVGLTIRQMMQKNH